MLLYELKMDVIDADVDGAGSTVESAEDCCRGNASGLNLQSVHGAGRARSSGAVCVLPGVSAPEGLHC